MDRARRAAALARGLRLWLCGGADNTTNSRAANASANVNANSNINANVANGGFSNSSNASNTSANLNGNANAARNANTAAQVDSGVDAYLASLPIGEAAFNTPEKLQLGETTRIELKLGGPQFAGNLDGRITAPGPVETHAVKIGAVMEAQLAGANFEITPLTPAEQPVAASEPTEWEWQIKPTAEGRQQLFLTLNIVVEVDGRERRRRQKTLQREISVEVSAGSRLGRLAYENLALIVTVVVVPLVGAIALRVRKWLRRDGQTPPPAG